MLQAIKNLIRYKTFEVPDKDAREAYNLWADNYDDQPDNLMFYLDQQVFTELMAGANISGKNIADIGCGTGRHWPFLFQNHVGKLTGYDVSEGMLKRLKLKFPDANTVTITGDYLEDVADETYDLIISTLTVAHIEDLGSALREWCRVLKSGGSIIITDFHPDALALGGKRTFKHQNTHIPIVNYVHPVHAIVSFFQHNGLQVVQENYRVVDDSVMHYYINQNAMHVYRKFRGVRMIFGMHIKKM